MHQHSLNLKNITNPSVRSSHLMAKRSGADDLFLGASLPPKQRSYSTSALWTAINNSRLFLEAADADQDRPSYQG